ncbi:unnamed protein product [Prorocentrum cordatum]|uniref:Uncharacterized protein n=1 Tax=Prorocentrum cordatum TaxID=2364126 RepID=A0ABN9PNB9_9DINO|nr:unnamed protein product [Polarella glacialis]
MRWSAPGRVRQGGSDARCRAGRGAWHRAATSVPRRGSRRGSSKKNRHGVRSQTVLGLQGGPRQAPRPSGKDCRDAKPSLGERVGPSGGPVRHRAIACLGTCPPPLAVVPGQARPGPRSGARLGRGGVCACLGPGGAWPGGAAGTCIIGIPPRGASARTSSWPGARPGEARGRGEGEAPKTWRSLGEGARCMETRRAPRSAQRAGRRQGGRGSARAPGVPCCGPSASVCPAPRAGGFPRFAAAHPWAPEVGTV